MKTCAIKTFLFGTNTLTKTLPITIEVYDSITQVDNHHWNQFLPENKQFLNASYLRAIELHHNDLKSYYAMIYHDSDLMGLVYFQVIDIHNGLRINDKHDKDFKEKVADLVKSGINKLSVRLLLCGNAFITGDYGFAFKSGLSDDVVVTALNQAMEMLQDLVKPTTALIKDWHPDDLEAGRLLTDQDFKEVHMQPNMILEMWDEWKTFEDYLACLTSKYRKNAKRLIKKGTELERRKLSVQEVIEQNDQIYTLFKNISDNADFNLTTPAYDYFLECKKNAPDLFQIMGYYYENKLIGFISYLVNGDHLETHFIGYEKEHNQQFALYTNVLYDQVKIGIEAGVKAIYFGRTALEIKSNLGAVGKEYNSFFWAKNPIFHRYGSVLFERLKDGNEGRLRHPFKEREPKKVNEAKEVKKVEKVKEEPIKKV